jgi:HEAT repeats
MRHKKYESLIVLSYYDEMVPGEKEALDEHLVSCPRCRKFREKMNGLLPVRRAAAEPVNDNDLIAARTGFRRAISAEMNDSAAKQTVLKFRPRANLRPALIPAYAAVAAGFAMLVIGVASGYLLFGRAGTENDLAGIIKEVSSKNSNNVAISDVRFVSTDKKSGKLEFSFDLVRRFEMKGSLDDQGVQKILAFALVNSDNPGVRLRTVGMLGGSASVEPDKDVRDALVKALKSDDNAGVRREALISLAKMPFDSNIRDAFLYVLQNDKNPGMRVAAINTLSEKQLSARPGAPEAKGIDPQVLEVLKDRSTSDQNRYVRLKAADMLKEFKEL